MNQPENLIARFETESCRDFLRHWFDLPKDGYAPHSRTFLDHAPALLMPQVMVLEVVPDGLMVRFVGTGWVERWKRDITGHFMGEGMPRAALERLQSNASHIARFPCGLRQITETSSSSGRKVGFEAVLLPLAVDEGRLPRVISFSQMLDTLDRQEHNDHFERAGVYEWLDLGAGVPAEPPFEY